MLSMLPDGGKKKVGVLGFDRPQVSVSDVTSHVYYSDSDRSGSSCRS